MICSFETVLMAVVISSIFLSITYFFLNHIERLIAIGYPTLSFLVVLALIRLLLPIEFPFTITILYSGFITKLFVFLQHKWTCFSFFSFSIYDAFLIIWAIGIVYYTRKYWRRRKETIQFISHYGKNETKNERYADILNTIYIKGHCKNRLQILELNSLESPMIFSITHPTILLPAKNTYSNLELFYIFKHEIAHFVHGDLITLALFQFLAIIYWWNPLAVSLNRKVTPILEMNIDSIVTHQDQKAIIEYITCLIHIKEDASNRKSPRELTEQGLSIENIQQSLLVKRCRILTTPDPPRRNVSVFLVIITIFIFILTYAFIIEPCEYPTLYEPDAPYFILTSENAYAIKNENDTYDIYWNGLYLETTDSMDYYDKSIPIYQNKEEIP